MSPGDFVKLKKPTGAPSDLYLGRTGRVTQLGFGGKHLVTFGDAKIWVEQGLLESEREVCRDED